MNEDEIRKHREAIDRYDDQILQLISERSKHVQAVGRIKGNVAQKQRPDREAQILRRMAANNPGPLSNEAVMAIWREIISQSMALEQRLVVSYLGPAGTFSHVAAKMHFGTAPELVPCPTIDEVFRQAETGAANFAVVPVENSTEGAVGRTLDLLLQTPLTICSEIVLRVRQNLMRKSNSLEGITRVYSHSQSLAQCQNWLSRNLPNAARVPVASNGEAARLAANEPDACAIGPALAAELYGLEIVAPDIEDEVNNATRFLVLGTNVKCGPTGDDLTSIVMSAPNRPGAVHALLTPIARHGISMTRIESRPSRLARWEYMFYVDLEGHQDDDKLGPVLNELKELAPFLKVLGSYPRAPR
ncbi:MAG: prephenate dehydratase [Burkholderiales bacterium]|nr:prephenate dehydratase [Burkholderiales bacterium]PZN03965.1 MAG: prephenate dehydratase [Pseudomonadota bacterium]